MIDVVCMIKAARRKAQLSGAEQICSNCIDDDTAVKASTAHLNLQPLVEMGRAGLLVLL
jgi:hypothetical protein